MHIVIGVGVISSAQFMRETSMKQDQNVLNFMALGQIVITKLFL